MLGFILGLILGVAGKAIYDLFKEEQLPAGMGLNTGRIEALLDETRQTVRDLREELRQALASEGTVQEKAGRLLSTAGEAVKAGRAGDAAPGEGAPQTEPKLTVTGSDVGGAGEAGTTGGSGSSGAAARGGSQTSDPT
jgi:hypothetical protein